MTSYNRAFFRISTIGTGDVIAGIIGAVSDSYFTPDEAGAIAGFDAVFVITENDNFELVAGLFTGSPVSGFQRTSVRASKIGGVAGTSKMNLAGNARVQIVEDALTINNTAKLNVANIWFANQDYNGFRLQRPLLRDYRETINIIGNTNGGTENIFLTIANVITATINAATTFAFFASISGVSENFTLKLTNGGAFTVTWPGSVDWGDAEEPDLTLLGVDVLVFETTNNGVTWHGFLAGSGFAS